MRSPDVLPLLTLELQYEHDVVLARQRARQIAQLLGFDTQDQTRIATAVSELARNTYEYATGGKIQFGVDSTRGTENRNAPHLVIRLSDTGPGIADVQAILDGRYTSPTGMGLGILGARRLVEHFRIESAPGTGTIVEIGRSLPASVTRFAQADAARIAAALAHSSAESSFAEMQRLNHELVRALDEIRGRQAETERLNAELEATNRGVLALYAELDDRAEDLRRASEAKSRFLSDISHELRTPLTSVLNLTRLLMDRTDGELTPEQERQVSLIRNAVETVSELVNELLDIAKIEAGRTTLHHAELSVPALFAALRGICRPLLIADTVTLVFEDQTRATPLHTDEKRLAQILRNFLSNAIKFTDRGAVRVVASEEAKDFVRFAVIDTGIGIAPDDQERIFQDYVQVDGPVQRRVRGTGLGLPLARKLAGLLGGRVELESAVGKGSTFSVVVPRDHPEWVAAQGATSAGSERADGGPLAIGQPQSATGGASV